MTYGLTITYKNRTEKTLFVPYTPIFTFPTITQQQKYENGIYTTVYGLSEVNPYQTVSDIYGCSHIINVLEILHVSTEVMDE